MLWVMQHQSIGTLPGDSPSFPATRTYLNRDHTHAHLIRTATMSHKGAAARCWVLTLNKYTDDDIAKFKAELNTDLCIYAVTGKEIGEQGFIHLHTKKRLTGLKKKLSNKTHFEKARGTDEENQKYCTKEGNILLQTGQPDINPMANTSYKTATELAKKIADGQELADLLEDEEYAKAIAKYQRYVETLHYAAMSRFDSVQL